MATPQWWMFPFKPVRITEQMFRTSDWSQWVLERKYDGFRCVLIVGADGSAALWTRERKPIATPDNLRAQIASLGLPPGTVLDGEIWTPTKRGSWRHDKAVACNLTFWDVVRAGSVDVSQEALEKRHERLVGLIGQSAPNIMAVEQYPATAEAFEEALRTARAHRSTTDSRSGFIHGVVLKKKSSPRRDHPTRTIDHPDWLKVCFWQSGEIR